MHSDLARPAAQLSFKRSGVTTLGQSLTAFGGACCYGFLAISPMLATVSPFFIEGTAQI